MRERSRVRSCVAWSETWIWRRPGWRSELAGPRRRGALSTPSVQTAPGVGGAPRFPGVEAGVDAADRNAEALAADLRRRLVERRRAEAAAGRARGGDLEGAVAELVDE